MLFSLTEPTSRPVPTIRSSRSRRLRKRQRSTPERSGRKRTPSGRIWKRSLVEDRDDDGGYDRHRISLKRLTNTDNGGIVSILQYPSFAQANTVSEFSHARSLYVFGHFCSSASSNRCTLLGTLEGEIPPGICQLNMMTTPSL